MSIKSLQELKKNRSSVFEKLTQKMNDLNSSNSNKDDGLYWTPTVDKAGNGYAVVRFLPAPQGEDSPFVRVFDHGFKGPKGKWYIEKSLTTLGQEDPCSVYNSALWNTSNDDESPERKQARLQKRRLSYHVNIYVIKDAANQDNEGKVFLWKVGKKIWDKIHNAMYPEFEDEMPMNPFDMWEGANFKLKIRQVEGYRNYDKSEFDTPAPLSEDDGELEKIWSQCHSLEKIVDPSTFKSYSELEAQLKKVLCLDEGAIGAAKNSSAQSSRSVPHGREEYAPPKGSAERAPAVVDEDDDLAFFKEFANES